MRVHVVRQAVAAMVLVLGLVAAALARPRAQSEHAYGIYSNLEAADGDISGFELIVLPSNEGDFVVFQQAEGAPQKPVLLRARIGGTRRTDANALAFEHPELGPFQGAFSADSLIGEFTSIGYELRLGRGQSFWQ